MRWLQRRLGWSRKLLSLLLVVVIFGVIGGCLGILTYAAANELVSLAQNWSGMLTQVEGFFDQMEALFARAMDLLPLSVVGTVEDTVNALIQRLQAVDPTALLSAAKAATDWAMRVPEFLLALVVFVMASYFLTADYPYHRTRAVQHLDESLLRFLQQVKVTALAAFGGYLRAELLLSVGVFFILLGGFLLVGQNYALLLALGLAILDFIPIIGSGTVMVPWAVVALFTRDFSTAVYLMVIWGWWPCSAGWRSHGSWATPDRPVPYPVPGGHLRGHEGGRSGWHDPGTHPHPGGAEPGRAGDLSGLLDGCDGRRPGTSRRSFPSGRSGNERVCQSFFGNCSKNPPSFFMLSSYLDRILIFVRRGKRGAPPGHSSNRQGVFEMANQDNEFNFYNSENDGYRGGFGGYTDSNPNQSQGGPEAPQGPQKHRGSGRRIAALILACAVVGGGAGVGGAACTPASSRPSPA